MFGRKYIYCTYIMLKKNMIIFKWINRNKLIFEVFNVKLLLFFSIRVIYGFEELVHLEFRIEFKIHMT